MPEPSRPIEYIRESNGKEDYVCNPFESKLDHHYPIGYIINCFKYANWHLPIETLNCYLFFRSLKRKRIIKCSTNVN